jgi:hypothetical protein
MSTDPQQTGCTGDPGTPVQRTPAEIWAKIIHWTIGGPGAFIDQTRRNEFLKLRQVSPLWRTTAFSTPYLWRHLSVAVAHTSIQDRSRLKELIPQWFGRAGQGAQVHLRFGGWGDAYRDHLDWVDALWPLEGSLYRLATLYLWGDAIYRADLPQDRPTMLCLRNLSLTFEQSRPLDGNPFHLDVRFPDLESLALSGMNHASFLRPTFRHPHLRSLLISNFTVVPQDFVAILGALPMLEELVLRHFRFAYRIGGKEHMSQLVHKSLQTLVCNPFVLSTWPNVILSSIKFLKLIPYHQSYRGRPEGGGRYLFPHDNNFDLSTAGNTISQWRYTYLTIDLTLLDLESRGIIPFLSAIPPLQSLRMKSLAPLLCDDTPGQEWRKAPNVEAIICQEFSALPPSFVITPFLIDQQASPPASTSILLPNPPGKHKDMRYHLQDITNAQGLLSLTHLSEHKIAALLEDGAFIRSHAY